MNRNRLLVVSTIVLSVALAGCSGGKAPAAAPAAQKAISVEVAQTKKGSIADEAGIIGSFAPTETAQVAPKISSKIQSINLKIGQNVNQGDVLFTLDQKDIQDNVKQAQESYQVSLASLKQAQSSATQSVQQAESSVDQAKSAIVQQESAITQAKNAIADAQNTFQEAQTALSRSQQLFAAGAVSQTDLEQAQTTHRQAQSALNNAQLTLTNAQSSLDSANTTYRNAQKSLQLAQQKTGIDVSKASVNQSKASLDTARDQLANAVVRAPISGTISVVNGTTGQMVGAQSAVVTIAKTNPILAKVNLSEAEMMKLKVGSPVTIGVDSLDKTFEAKVTAISPVMDNDLHAYPVEISVPNPSGTLKSGMVMYLYVKSAATENLLVSQDAVTEQSGKKYVYIIEANVAKRVEVETGEESSKQVEVIKGLSEGQTVVVKGASLLTDGAKVSVVKK